MCYIVFYYLSKYLFLSFFVVENASMPNVPSGTSGSGASAEEAVPALSWPPETFEASGDEDSLMGLTNNG